MFSTVAITSKRCCWCWPVQLFAKQRAWELLWEWEFSPVPALLGSSVAGRRKWPRTLLRLMWSEIVLGSNLKRRVDSQVKGLRLYVEWRVGDHDDDSWVPCTVHVSYQDSTFNRGVIETIKAFQLPKSQIKGIDHFFHYAKLSNKIKFERIHLMMSTLLFLVQMCCFVL